MVRMAIHQNHRICDALGAPAGTLYPVRATPWTAFAGEDAAADQFGPTREHHLLFEYPSTLIRDW